MVWHCFSCFKPTVTEDDTNIGPSTSTAAPHTPRAAAPSISTAAPSTSRGAERVRVDSEKQNQLALDKEKSSFEVGSSSQSQNTQDLLSFRLEELQTATNNFTSECLGEGCFGKVYKGHFEKENQDAAIKKFKLKGKGNQQFVREVEVLRKVDHPNIVKLLGFCSEKEDRLLVYEYMALGSLDTHLFDLPPSRQPLDWNTRIKIAIDIASGLEYLHDNMNPSVIHGDLKSTNILLGEGYLAKLSDFGTESVGPTDDETHISTKINASNGYTAPEYQVTGHLTRETDIFSLGIVLLELITGKVAIDSTRPVLQQKLIEWVKPVFLTKDREIFPEVADPRLAGQYTLPSLERALYVAQWCLNLEVPSRPKIAQVVHYLKRVIPRNHPQIHSENPASPRD